MTNTRLNMLARASLSGRKLTNCFYVLFVIVSAVLALVSVSSIIPMEKTINDKINNHIANSEIMFQIPADISDEYKEDELNRLKQINHVKDIYKYYGTLECSETSGVFQSVLTLQAFHKNFDSTITAGRNIKDNETGVALLPNNISDFDEDNKKFNFIKCKDLIGKTIVLADEANIQHKLKVVGTYSPDPTINEKVVIVSNKDMANFCDKIEKAKVNEQSGEVKYDTYIMLADKPENRDAVFKEMSVDYASATESETGIDAGTYNMALIILFASFVLFIVLTVVGYTLFLKNNISTRIKEIALYRSFGYKSSNLFYILFVEHIISTVVAYVVGVVGAFLLNKYVVGSYLNKMFDDSFINITPDLNWIEIVGYFAFLVLVLAFVCYRAVKKSEKTDLTILLRET